MGVEQQNHHKDQKEITQRFGLFVKFVNGQKPLPPHYASETRKTTGIEIMLDEKKISSPALRLFPSRFNAQKKESERKELSGL